MVCKLLVPVALLIGLVSKGFNKNGAALLSGSGSIDITAIPPGSFLAGLMKSCPGNGGAARLTFSIDKSVAKQQQQWNLQPVLTLRQPSYSIEP